MREKTKRNTSIYLQKEGKTSINSKKIPENRKTYRELSKKYNISIEAIRKIVNRYRSIYG